MDGRGGGGGGECEVKCYSKVLVSERLKKSKKLICLLKPKTETLYIYICVCVCGGGYLCVCVFASRWRGVVVCVCYKIISNANIVNKKESRASLNFPVHLIEE